MPTETFLADAAFVTTHSNLVTYVIYMQQWAQAVQSLGTQIQADPNFTSGLTAAEQTAVQAVTTASAALIKAVPVTASSSSPNPSPITS